MDKIAILDFGGQYAHLIANRVRRIGVYSEIIEPDTDYEKLLEYKGFIFSGGPASVRDPNSLKCDPRIFEIGVPILGLCYGHQYIAYSLGGNVQGGNVQEYGPADVKINSHQGIFEGLNASEIVWMSHFDQVVKPPKGFEIIAETKDCPIAGLADFKRNIYSLQFHPEVTHTPNGMIILKNFVDLTDAEHSWSMDAYADQILKEIEEKVGDKNAFLMVSGGVDSTVAFTLLDKALGQNKVYGLFVDIGFMRANERIEVEASLKKLGIENLHIYDAGEEFYKALENVYEPEKKRKIIGNLFIDIQERLVNELGLDPENWILAQGTIYPDTIETGNSKSSHTIKTHHNRVERIQKMIDAGKVIEPLEQLYKDEVRAIGEKLGLKKEMVWRHPFPGPGLAVRCLCAKGESYPENVEEVEKKINDFLEKDKLKANILPVKSVGVQGDERTYKHPVVLHGESTDWDVLSKLGSSLTNSFQEVNRVLLGLYPQDFSQLTTHDVFITKSRIKVLQIADKLVMDFLREKGIYGDIWQFPTVLIPVDVGNTGGESIVLRPVNSTDVMSANFYKMSEENLKDLTSRLSKLDGVSGVFYDITNKPPGTIEWE